MTTYIRKDGVEIEINEDQICTSVVKADAGPQGATGEIITMSNGQIISAMKKS